MIELTSVQAALGSLKSASDIVKAILDAREISMKNEKALELGGILMAAQSHALSVYSQLTAAIGEIGDLKKRIADMETWAAEKDRYELKEIATGRFAYTIKESERGMEPPHHLCASCYNDGVKSILQTEMRDIGRKELLICHRCSAELFIQGARDTLVPRVLNRRPPS